MPRCLPRLRTFRFGENNRWTSRGSIVLPRSDSHSASSFLWLRVEGIYQNPGFLRWACVLSEAQHHNSGWIMQSKRNPKFSASGKNCAGASRESSKSSQPVAGRARKNIRILSFALRILFLCVERDSNPRRPKPRRLQRRVIATIRSAHTWTHKTVS